jgi:hypothetical protein
MQGILYEETSIFLFLLITVVIGGWAAWMTGRACAVTWRSPVVLFFYVLALGAAVRFVHFAVFEGTLLSLHYYLVDTVILELIAFVGFRYTRTKQMVRQYFWLYERSGPISFRPKAG